MPPPSSGGSTVGEALNILQNVDLRATYKADRDQGAARLPRGERAGLRRPRRVRRCTPGDAARRAEPVAVAGVRRRAVLRARPDQGGHQAGACRQPGRHATTPTATARSTAAARPARDNEGLSTTHLTTADRWGNVVTYTLTIEQTGGSALTVPGSRLPAQQRADRLRPRPRLGRRTQRARPRQAAAVVDVTDDRQRPRPAGARPRLAGRLDDHHHGAAGAAQPARLRDVDAACRRGTAGQPAEHQGRAGGSRLRPGRPRYLRAHLRRPAGPR